MKKLQFLLLTCILTFAVSCGQQKRYVSYKVQEGETMRDIAKRLDMKTRDLLRLNPDIGRKPNANTVIVIPNPDITKTGSSSTSSKDITEEIEDIKTTSDDTDTSTIDITEQEYQYAVVDYETHEVLKGETVYRITKKYGITKDELISLNPKFPEIKTNTLSIGQVLKVKVTEKIITVNKEEVLKNFLTHTVKSKETIYSLTRFYNVTKEELLKLNPEFPALENNQLSIGQLLKIKPIEEVGKNENYTFYKDSIAENTTINLAVLLPFKADEYASSTTKEIFENNRLTNMVTDFYLGLEIAVDSIKQQGVNVQLNVFDTGNRGEKTTDILAENNFKNTDVIIGPFYSNKAETIAGVVDTPIIFPHYSSKQQQFLSSKLVKTSPEKNKYNNYLATYLKDEYDGEEIFIVADSTLNSSNNANKITTLLKQHSDINNIHILKPKDGYIKAERFTDKMNATKHNWVIICSVDNVVVADALNSMIGLPDDMTVQVFTPNMSEAFYKVDNNKLASMKFTYVSSTYTDEKSEETKSFNKKYFNKNNTIPSDYAIKGFDVTYDVLMRLASGNTLKHTFKEGISFRVENKFDYNNKPFGSTSNQGLFIVKYNYDLSLSRLR